MNADTPIHTRHSHVIVRNMTKDDIPKVVELQKIAFPAMAAEWVYWKPDQLKTHLEVFLKVSLLRNTMEKLLALVAV